MSALTLTTAVRDAAVRVGKRALTSPRNSPVIEGTSRLLSRNIQSTRPNKNVTTLLSCSVLMSLISSVTLGESRSRGWPGQRALLEQLRFIASRCWTDMLRHTTIHSLGKWVMLFACLRSARCRRRDTRDAAQQRLQAAGLSAAVYFVQPVSAIDAYGAFSAANGSCPWGAPSARFSACRCTVSRIGDPGGHLEHHQGSDYSTHRCKESPCSGSPKQQQSTTGRVRLAFS